jgi:ankyrin repeat protein
METLFDPDKPHFEKWVGLYDIDKEGLMWDVPEDPSPLYYSVLCGFYDLVEHLAIKHPHYVNAIGGEYEFPLLAALGQGHVEVAKLLLEYGADANAENSESETPLHILSYSNINDRGDILNLVQLLLKHGAVMNSRTEDRHTPLHLAIQEDRFKLAEILLEHGADPIAENNGGQTPLHILSESDINLDAGDLLNLVLLLLKHGAAVNIRSKNRSTPLHLAIRRNRLKLAEILLENGADPIAEDNGGQTPLHILSERNIQDAGDLLNLLLFVQR